MRKLLEKDSMNDLFEDEVIRFLRIIANGNKWADPFLWWKTNDYKYSHVAILVRDTIFIPESSMPSEKGFFWGWQLITPHKTRLFDE